MPSLHQSLQSFRAKNAQYFAEVEYSDEGRAFMEAHDVAHVVFGCDVSIYGEGVVKLWTTFGTTLSFWEVTTGYQDANAFQLARGFSWGHVLRNIGRLLVDIPKVIYRARQMHKAWPFYDYKSYLDRNVEDIREEFGIRVLERP